LPTLASPGPVDWVAGTSFMARAEALRATGGFDEDFFLYWEEVELCHRITKAGFAIHGLPAAKVRHVGGVSTGMHRDERQIPGYWHQSRNTYFSKTRTGGPVMILNVATALALVIRRCLELVRRKPMAHPHFARDHIKYALNRYLERH
jgi:N-acetylglucosaminyl-diphospho-decaprenol L-rhamnosyltransferase